MLCGVNPNCPPDLLYCLACMGHGDELMIADRNYPAHAHAAEAAVPRPIALPSFDALAAIKMITELMPIDNFHSYGALRMEIDDAPNEMNASHRAVFEHLAEVAPLDAVLGHIGRHAFYQHAKSVFGIVHTTEDQPYGSYIFRTGVIF